MKNKVILFFSIFFCALSEIYAQNAAPINENATKEARQLLNYLYKIQGKHVLSGQHNAPHELRISTDTIVSYVGEATAIWGSDFINVRKEADWKVTIDEALQAHQSGAIITLMYHQGRPYPDSIGFFRDKINDEDWEELITPGTAIHQTWQKDIDKLAAHLKVLQENNVPVLWRPYHEMNGPWFWWGRKLGENGYPQLWQMLYQRLTEYHQLNNLIWVWNANAPKKDSLFAYHFYFPGIEHVDVLAADIYLGDYKQSHHDQLLEMADGKPIAMGEIGKVPSPEIFDQQDEWVWFMIWHKFPWTKNTREDVQALYKHPKVLTKSEVSR